ncbi:MAG: hypothetical protein JXA96_07460 [Sedimentisphaerales bacterium]|nr:hypothetical protein [Sedimentisphaerales bacterium]
MLYQQNDSISDALNFIEVPEEKMETYLTTVQNNGELASGDILKFANKYFSLRTSKNSERYISMLSDKTKEIIDDDNKNGSLFYHINRIKNGTFLNSENEYKYFAVSSIITNELQNSLKRDNFTQMPTHRIIFYYFNEPRDMLMVSSVYMVKEQDSYKIVTETMSKDEAEKLIQTEKKNLTQEYGIISYQEISDDKTGSMKHIFSIAVKPDDTVNNTFEIVKLTELISEQENSDIAPEITEKVLTDSKLFEKYKDKQLNFKFIIEYKEPESNTSSSGKSLSSWIYSISIASYDESSTMYYIGQNIQDIKVNKDGDFLDSDLELMSFESQKDGKKYKNRILLRKTPVENITE